MRISVEKNDPRIKELDVIVGVVSDYFGISLDFVSRRSREREIVEPRQIAMYLAFKKTNFTLKTIGQYFNGRNHATVLYACYSIKRVCEVDRQLKHDVDQMIFKIDSKIIPKNDRIHSIGLSENQSVVLIGFTEQEINSFKEKNNYN